jgi:two-component system sensor histidine kinase/response regulator
MMTMRHKSPQEHQRKKILLVDDSPENIRILLEVLKDDYQVVAAKDGNKALELAAQLPLPDLILLDVLMPLMDGYEVCRQLKQQKKTQDIPVIFVTALAEDVSEERGFNVGAVDYITKPISPAIVRARVRTHLALKAAHQQLEDQNMALIEATQLREDVERIMQHDLKGPLTTIIGMPALLLNKENITAQQKETLALIKDAGYLMLGMINRSLDLYKMEVGSYRYKPQQFDLLPLLSKVFAESDNLATAYAITMQLCIDGREVMAADTFPVMGEELLCHTMLSNLLRNAVEASPEGGVVVVDLGIEAGCPQVRLHNSGAVPVEIRDNFFSKYSTSGKDAGTGLGTYSALQAARVQGGDILLDTSDASATTVVVKFAKQ